MICLEYSPISSANGTLDKFINLTGALEATETITTANVVSSIPALVEVSNIAVNVAPYTDNGITTAIGKGVGFSVKTLAESNTTVELYVDFVGNNGSALKYTVELPVVETLRR